jgi:adenylate cyclase
MILHAPAQAKSMATTFLLDEVAQDLVQDQNSPRIKKLLVYACTHTWESDQKRLDQIKLQDLLLNLLAKDGTLELLQAHLNCVVGTLNKSAEYALVANTIIHRISKLYPEVEQVKKNCSNWKNYEEISRILEQDSEKIRIKKLLFLTCKNTWENDLSKLNQLSLLDLIQETHRLASTLENLNTVLVNLAKSLSKRVEYTAIAEKISQVMQPLYSTDPSTPVLGLPEATQALTPLLNGSVSRLAPEVQLALSEATQTLSGSISNPKILEQPEISNQPLHSEKPRANSSYRVIQPPRELADRFSLRLEIMQYTTPLRAKILLFSVLHEPFQHNAEYDSMLKSHELDELLRILIHTYKQFEDLESNLQSTAKALAEAEEYVQPCGVLLRAIKPFYASLEELKVDQDCNQIPTEIRSVEADSYELTKPEGC